MIKPALFVTQPLFPQHEKMLSEFFDLSINRDDSRVISIQELHNGLQGKDVLFCRLGDPITGEVIKQALNLHCIVTMATRTSDIDMDMAKRCGIHVIARQNTLSGMPSADNTPDTAELCITLLAALVRQIVPADYGLRHGTFPGPQSHRYAGLTLAGMHLGLIGMGPVAQAVVPRAQAFGMKVWYWSRSRHEDVERRLAVQWLPLDLLLATSDVISLHLRSTPETRHFMGAERFARMKEQAIFINTARGDLVDSAAMFEALRRNRLWGIALDVFEDEPSPCLPEDLRYSPRLLVTPHLGSAVRAKREIMEQVVCHNLLNQLGWLQSVAGKSRKDTSCVISGHV